MVTDRPRGGSAATSISAICRLPSTGTSIPTVSTDSRSRVERQVSDPSQEKDTVLNDQSFLPG